MKTANQPVLESYVRPARPDGTCFYCHEPVGSQHKAECVARVRTVVCRVCVEIVRQVPESWDPGSIEFTMNESSSCGNNLVCEIVDLLDRFESRQDEVKHMGPCLCAFVNGEFMREATEEDLQAQFFKEAE